MNTKNEKKDSEVYNDGFGLVEIIVEITIIHFYH